MPTPLTLALDRARTDWLAGDADAWIRYRACLAQLQDLAPDRPDRPRELRRPVRPRRPRAQA